MAMDELGMARDVLGMEERRVERAEACRRLHEVKLDGGSHEMLSAIARAVLPDATMGWTVGACERLRAHLVWLLGAGMPEIQALGEDVGKQSMSGHGGPQIGSQGFKENRMSITDELREWAEQHKGWHLFDMQLNAIADRIDAEHEAALLNVHTDLMDARGWVRMPVDADGEPWRLGDELMMEGEVCEVVGFGGHTIFYAFGDGVEWTIAHNNRHYHALTVEDVLREFAQEMSENLGMYTGEAIDADEWRDADSKTIAEYAAKLRLAGDAE